MQKLTGRVDDLNKLKYTGIDEPAPGTEEYEETRKAVLEQLAESEKRFEEMYGSLQYSRKHHGGYDR